MTHRATNIVRVIVTALMFAMNSITYAEKMPNDPRPAGGIRTDFGDVLIENVGIGRTYNLRDLAGTPFKVTNTGAGTIDLQCDVVTPSDSMIKEKRKAGYKPIPDASWVTLSQGKFIVPSGESAVTDVLISIPNDPTLYGKKYQASIYSRTMTVGGLNVGVWSHLLIDIALSPEDQERIEKNRKKGLPSGMEYSLLPDKIVLVNFPLGQKINVRKTYKRTLMLANPGTINAAIKATVIPLSDSPLTLQLGYENPTNLSWLKLGKSEFDIEPSNFEDPEIEISLPKDPALKGKKFMFVIRVEPSNPDVTGVTYYGKVYVDVEEK